MFKKLRRYWFNLTHPIIGEVWELHRVTLERSHDERYAKYDITPKRLESLIIEYKKRGYTFISIDEVVERINKKRSDKFICVTLDDGYADSYEVAYPIFKKYSIPFCIYIVSGCLGNVIHDRHDCPFLMTAEQLKELDKDNLCTIGAHTVSHINLAKLTLKKQKQEIVGSIDYLSNLLGHNIKHFSSPFGSYNRNTIQILKQVCIQSHVESWGGPVRKGINPLHIPRCIIEETGIKF